VAVTDLLGEIEAVDPAEAQRISELWGAADCEDYLDALRTMRGKSLYLAALEDLLELHHRLYPNLEKTRESYDARSVQSAGAAGTGFQ